MEKTMNSHQLPQTDSIQELARFWDTHDLTDFEEELEQAKEQVFEKDKVIPLHLHSQEAEALRQFAQAKGVADEELVREWVIEKLQAG
jgi:predicted DNA binding CopG/RHH family protein